MNDGDALSKLIQVHCRRVGLTIPGWSGEGNMDLLRLVTFASNNQLLSKCLWDGIKELDKLRLNDPRLPEPIVAQICCIILKAQTLLELAQGKRNEKAQRTPMPTGGPPPVPPGTVA
jgi:hypothetical protein